MQHLDEGTIHAWLDGALDADGSARVERHIAECAACSEAVAEARGMIAGASRIVSSLDTMPGNVVPRRAGGPMARGRLWRSLRLTPARAALAATLLLAVATMLTIQHSPNGGASVPSSTGAAAAVSKATAPSGSLETAARTPAAPPPVQRVPPSTNPAPVTVAVVGAADEKPRTAAPTVPAALTAPAAPPQVANAAAKAVAKAAATSQALALAENVTVSATGRVLDSMRADSVKPLRANASDSLRSAAMAGRAREFAGARTTQGASPLADAVLRSGESSQCYRVSSDSAELGVAGALLPRRFSLQQSAGPPLQNIVRAVAPDGRIDSTIVGARWERLSPTTTRLYLARQPGESPPTLTLRFADGHVAGQLVTPAGSRDIDLSRSNCRP